MAPDSTTVTIRSLRPNNAARLDDIVGGEQFDGAIERRAIEDFLQATGVGRSELIAEALRTATAYALPATSGYPVGAVCEGQSGNLYLGANLEVPRASLLLSLHAEQSAILDAFAHGEIPEVRL